MCVFDGVQIQYKVKILWYLSKAHLTAAILWPQITGDRNTAYVHIRLPSHGACLVSVHIS